MTGGAASYRKGAAHERRVATFLRERGALVVRSPQSGQEMDLTVLWPLPETGIIFEMPQPWLVQCKTNGYMRPGERVSLIELAALYGCRPILAGPGTLLKDLLTGRPIEASTDQSVRPDPPQDP